MQVSNEDTEIKKPNTLQVTSALHAGKAPLASPDASNISGSSDSSINNGAQSPPDGDSVFRQNLNSHPHLDGQNLDDNSIGDSTSLEERILNSNSKDSDSFTSSNVSVSTVLSANRASASTGVVQGKVDSSPCRTVNRSVDTKSKNMSDPEGHYADPRFLIRTFKSFSASEQDSRLSTFLSDKSRNSNVSDNSVFSDNHDFQNNNPTDSSDLDLQANRSEGHLVLSESETDTESTMSSSLDLRENRSLLLSQKEAEHYSFHGNHTGQEVGGVPSGEHIQSESDDTDSISTPTDSPQKARLESLDLQPPPLQTGKQPFINLLKNNGNWYFFS